MTKKSFLVVYQKHLPRIFSTDVREEERLFFEVNLSSLGKAIEKGKEGAIKDKKIPLDYIQGVFISSVSSEERFSCRR